MRPTAAKVRSAIFDRLQAEVEGARVLDLFAGSGALSIEAISRGASHAELVEHHPALVRHLRAQMDALDLQGVTRIHPSDVLRFLNSACEAPFDLVVLDPPYAGSDVVADVLEGLVQGGWLATGAVVVSERGRKGAVAGQNTPDLHLEKAREYGQTLVEFHRYEPSTA